ncbi:MAG: EamA family transporter [Nitriliruptorales bacterium]
MTTVVILLAAVALATTGQLLLKAGMNRVGEVELGAIGGLLAVALKVLTTWQVVLGLVMFGLSAAFWLVTLSRVPLSTAYPVVSLSYVLILLFSVVALGERPTTLVWVGAFLIMVGISAIGIGQR